MDTSINFKGAFLVRQPSSELRDAIQPILNRTKKQVLEDFSGKGNILYVISNKSDKEFADLLQLTPYARFKYYPNLSTRTGLNKDRPEEAKAILKANEENCITSKNKLREYFINLFQSKQADSIKKIQNRNIKSVEKATFVTIDFNEYTKQINKENGVCQIFKKVYDKQNKKNRKFILMEITPPGKHGICYARYVPESEEKDMRRFAIRNGKIIFEYTDPGSKNFYLNSEAAKQFYLEKERIGANA